MKELTGQQRLNLINSDQIYESYRAVLYGARSYAHGIKWKKVSGREYLVRGTKTGEKSLGLRSPATEAIYSAFIQGRFAAKEKRLRSISSLEEQAAINKALKIGRAPEVVAKLLRKLDEKHLIEDFLVIGTQAIYAYESMAGVQFLSELMATADVDLLYDNRKSLSVVSKKMDGNGLIGLLRKIDKSFEPVLSGSFRAHNADHFMVDLVSQETGIGKAVRVRFSDNDSIAAEAPGLQWLCNSPKSRAIAIDSKGFPFPIIAPDPRAFAIHKAWLSNQKNRDVIKKPRDLAQAVAVAKVVIDYLPHLSFSETIGSLHADARRFADLLPLMGGAEKPKFKG